MRLVRRRIPPSVVAIALAILGVIAAGLAGHVAENRASPSPAGSAAIADVVPSASISAPASPRFVPLAGQVDCRGVGQADCTRIVAGALESLPTRAAVRSVAAYTSLLCDSSLDCPPALLAASRPLGSAVVSFVDGGSQAWVNVVEVEGLGGAAVESWVVSWRQPPRRAGTAPPSPGP